LNLSYGTGRIFVVPHENIGGRLQGGVTKLPIEELPTGVMRGRFHPGNGHLYACGMFAWAGNRQHDGGFYRIRATGKRSYLPIRLHARTNVIEIAFTEPLEREFAAKAENYSVKVWSLQRSANYGSKHIGEHAIAVAEATVSADGKTVTLRIPELQPTQSMEIKATLRGKDGAVFTRTIHNTLHALGN
jgi:hypothetical protein